MLNLWAVTPVGSTRFEWVATNSAVTHREEATPTHREEVTSTRRVALIHRSFTLAARCEEREEKEKQPHPLKQRSTRDTREKKGTAKEKVSNLRTKFLLHLLLHGGSVRKRVLKGEALCLRQGASFFHAYSERSKQEIKSKGQGKKHGGKTLHIYIPESMYTEKTDMGEKKEFHDSNIRNTK